MLNRGYAYTTIISGKNHGQILLSHLASLYPHSTPQAWQQKLNHGEVTLNGVTAAGSESVTLPWMEAEAPRKSNEGARVNRRFAVQGLLYLPAMTLGGASQDASSRASQGRAPAIGPYADNRPTATMRLNATDQGSIIEHGQGPGKCDYLGAREAICFRFGGTYYLHYDGAGPDGWRACLAVSRDLRHWELKGPILDLGAPGEDDAGTASSPWTVFDGHRWHMFYVGCRTTSGAPNRIPSVPYFTLAATSTRPDGPWTKQRAAVPFRTKPGTYYADTASPGQIVKFNGEYLMFFSAAAFTNEPKRRLLRTLSIARTTNLDGAWKIDPQPALPPEQQIENSALYFEPSNRTWFLFTNHIGLDKAGEFTESIWVYWSADLNHWNPEQRAVVLDRTNCRWTGRCIGMPSVVPVGQRLALFYDACRSQSGNMQRDIGLAWIDLPLRQPTQE